MRVNSPHHYWVSLIPAQDRTLLLAVLVLAVLCLPQPKYYYSLRDRMPTMRFIFCLVFAATLANAAKPLDVYFVDVEGGQATLIVTPSKQSILVDTGWAGFNGRDALRIQAAAKSAGV